MENVQVDTPDHQIAQARNKEKELYCTECCASFRLAKENWVEVSNPNKVAQMVANRLLYCTCGTIIGVAISDTPPVIGEIVAVH